MGRLTGKISQYIVAFICIISLNFFLIHLMPGDPLIHLLGEEGYFYLSAQKPQALKELMAKYELDGPIYKQYFAYVINTLKADFGWSYHYGKPVFQVILYRLKWSMVLLLPSILIATILGTYFGILGGWKRGQKEDWFLTPVFLFVYSTPAYCLGFLFLLVFAFCFDLFPMGGMAQETSSGFAGLLDMLKHMVLPVTVLVFHNTAYNYLIMRNAVRDISHEEYIITAISKGLKESRVLFCHVLKNVLPPLITVVAMDFGFMLGGALLVEIVFSWQGMGTLIYDAVLSRDYPLLSACFLVLALCMILANAVADFIYSVVDPRIKDSVRNE